jgi:hypothetical protein
VVVANDKVEADELHNNEACWMGRAPRAQSSSSGPKPPAWMSRRSTAGPGRTARRGCSRRCFRINPAAAGARAGLMPGLRRSSNRRSANTSSRGSSGRSGRRRWKWRAAAAKHSCVRLTPTPFASESRRFQRSSGTPGSPVPSQGRGRSVSAAARRVRQRTTTAGPRANLSHETRYHRGRR